MAGHITDDLRIRRIQMAIDQQILRQSPGWRERSHWDDCKQSSTSS
jgi:hypothetical protein